MNTRQLASTLLLATIIATPSAIAKELKDSTLVNQGVTAGASLVPPPAPAPSLSNKRVIATNLPAMYNGAVAQYQTYTYTVRWPYIYKTFRGSTSRYKTCQASAATVICPSYYQAPEHLELTPSGIIFSEPVGITGKYSITHIAHWIR